MGRYAISIDADHDDLGAVKQTAGTVHQTITDTDDPADREFVVVVADLTDEERAEIESHPEVRYVEAPETHEVQGEPADEDVDDGGISVEANTQQLGYWIGKTSARKLPAVGQECHIAVVDSGADSDHPDLVDNLGAGYAACETTVSNPEQPWEDDHGHGSHVSGIIAATNNHQGMRGVAPAATIHPIKALDQDGRGTGDDLADALVHAANMEPRPAVVSCSWGGGGGGRVIHDAIKHCVSKGVLPVFAAGNSSGDVIYPAKHPECVAVSATNQQDGFANFSCYGEEVDLAAPGVGIRSTLPGGKYQKWQGTSMATPMVAAAAGLCRSPGAAGGLGLTAKQAWRRLTATADDVDLADDQQGAGRLDALAALTAGGPAPEPTPPNWDPTPTVPWPGGDSDPKPTPNTDMKELTIDATSKTDGPTWYFVDTDGDAELADKTEAPDAIKQAPSGNTRMSGKVAGGTDTFRFSGEITACNFAQNWHGLTVVIDGEAHDPTDLPGFDGDDGDGGGGDQPDEEYPDLREGGYVVGEDSSAIREIPGARNRDRVPVNTTGEIVLWIGPDGDDGNEGSKTNSLASIDEAIRRLPEHWYHDVFVYVKPGTYESPTGEGLTGGPFFQSFFDESRDGFTVRAVGDTREDVVFNGYRQFNMAIHGIGSYQDATFEHLTLNGTFTGYRGGYGIVDCKINPTRGNKVAIGGYDTTIHAMDCEFGDRTEHAVKAKETSTHVLNNCSGQANGGIVTGGTGIVWDWWGNDIDAPGWYDVDGATHAAVLDKDGKRKTRD